LNSPVRRFTELALCLWVLLRGWASFRRRRGYDELLLTSTP